MGITGLLPLLKDITWDVHVRSFSGKVAAIDASGPKDSTTTTATRTPKKK